MSCARGARAAARARAAGDARGRLGRAVVEAIARDKKRLGRRPVRAAGGARRADDRARVRVRRSRSGRRAGRGALGRARSWARPRSEADAALPHRGLHGVNLDLLGRRDPALYGTLTLPELERAIEEDARELGLQARFFQTNHEARSSSACTRSRRGRRVIINPGAWTHYAWAIRDALEIAALPAVEVHLSDIKSREPWRRLSVIGDLCLATSRGAAPTAIAMRSSACARSSPCRVRAVSAAAERGARRRARRAPGRRAARARARRAAGPAPLDVRYLTGFTRQTRARADRAERGRWRRRRRRRLRRASRAAAAAQHVLHRLPLRHAVGRAGARAVRARDRRRRPAGGVAASGCPPAGGRLGFDDPSADRRRARAPARAAAEGWELVAPRARSSACGRQGRSRSSRASAPRQRLPTRRCGAVLEAGLVGRTEREVAIELELRMRRLGAEAPSFPARSSPPARTPRFRTPSRARWRSSATCSSRSTGAPGTRATARTARALTRPARRSARARARDLRARALGAGGRRSPPCAPGSSGRELDAVARAVIESAGQGEHFGHGLGHGVGLEVHEPPRLSRNAGESRSRPATSSRSSPASTCPGCSACASRTSWSSARTSPRC